MDHHTITTWALMVQVQVSRDIRRDRAPASDVGPTSDIQLSDVQKDWTNLEEIQVTSSFKVGQVPDKKSCDSRPNQKRNR